MMIKLATLRRLNKIPDASKVSRFKRRYTARMFPQAQARQRDIVGSVDLGIWEWDTPAQNLIWDDGMYRLYGVTPGQWVPTYENWEKLIHPDDKRAIEREFMDSLRENRPYQLRFRIILPCGRIRHIEARSRTIVSPAGDIVRVVGVNWDATDQALAEAELRLQKNFNAAILENIPVAVYLEDMQDKGKILLWNKASEAMFNVKKARILGHSIDELWDDGRGLEQRAEERRLLRSGKALVIPEMSYETEKRGPIYLHAKKVPLIINEAAEPRYLICINEDITERKEAEDKRRRDEHEIKNLNQRLGLGVLAAGFGVWEYDLGADRLIWDEQMLRIYGHQRESFDGSLAAWDACIHPEDRDFVRSRFAQLLCGCGVDLFVFRCRRATDGAIRYVEGNGCMQLDPEGQPQLLVGMNRDITSRKLVEQALEKNELLFRAMFDGAPLGIALIDASSGRIEEVNPRYAQISGRSIEELKSIDWINILHPEDARTSLDLLQQLEARSLPELRVRRRLQRPDGAEVWVDISVAVIPQNRLTPARHLCMIEDVSEQVAAEAELKKAKNIAEESNQVKSTFLANMSHELRTPLSVIRGYAERLVHGQSDPQFVLKWASQILRSSQQLERLLGDILDLSRVEAGKMALELAPVPLEETLSELMRMLEGQAAEKNIELKLSFQGAVPTHFVTDPTRFKQILTNILQNAIKFTDHGQVELSVSFLPPQATVPRAQLSFEVKDTGIGIRPEQFEKIFETFSQADSSITRRFGGTGLGLPLARHLARLLGGDVVLKGSQPQKGSIFMLTVDAGNPTLLEPSRPFTPDPASPLPSGPEPDQDLRLPPLHLLLVEDAPDLRSLFCMILEEQGAVVDTAANGLEGLELAMRKLYDLILMDIQMPVLGGYEATRRLRQGGLKTPIIALTAHAMKGERERCLEMGFSGYLSKPVDFKKLLQMISSMAGTSQRGSAVATGP